MQSDFAIELTRVSKSYREAGRDQIIFRDLSVRIRHGELLVLLGRSGSGKSTLLNLISGIDSPSSGDIAIGGLNLTLLPERDRTLYRRKHMGFVFQAYNLIPTLTVRENLLLPLELNRFPRESYARKIDSLLQEVGLENRAEEFPDRLSGGEQQRVAVARALVHEPEIILADEPTGNLDLETGRKVLGLLDRCVRRSARTLIMVTHSEEVIGRADRVLHIRDYGLSEFEGSGAGL
ncbi:MAG: ABC transporter ATP-binding protein [Methylococcaceae bacterium]|nr:ABC transporter ATP-binding protein [Methylococcaceae bacterium]MCI0733283.1 ABC transporter ATP-binding protein [Methylococcaceae bacterium]